MDTTHFEKLKRMYLNAKINRGIFEGSDLIIKTGKATLTFTVDDRFHHAAGGMHGAIYFRMMDDAAYFAAASRVTDTFMLTKEFKVDLKRPFDRGSLRCEAEIMSEDENGTVARAFLYNEDGKVLSEGEGLFVKSRRSLDEVGGYS